ncbi:hypothetical protein BKA63DRAFT_281026 [Paraphoma chrysanthemicola]|nr:hypothetical protein BKA63DRAFT_281026 [Paraphoma chrysanthemicola]
MTENCYQTTCTVALGRIALLDTARFELRHRPSCLVAWFVIVNIMAASLCAQCRRINFAVLRGPSRSELEDLSRTRNPEYIYGAKMEDANERILYGTLRNMRQGAITCQLCSVLCHIIDRQGATGMSSRNLDVDNVVFVVTAGATSSYFGSICTITPPQQTGYVLQKLTLTAHEAVGAAHHG